MYATFHRELRADKREMSSALGEVRAQLARLGIERSAGAKIDLVLEELVANVIRHGFPDGDGAEHSIGIRFEIAPREVRIALEDDGVEFDPTLAPVPTAPANLEESRVGGLGIHLVRASVASMSYRRLERGNCLELVVSRGH